MKFIYNSDIEKIIEKFRGGMIDKAMANINKLSQREADFVQFMNLIYKNKANISYEYLQDERAMTIPLTMNEKDQELIEELSQNIKKYKVKIWDTLKTRTLKQLVYHIQFLNLNIIIPNIDGGNSYKIGDINICFNQYFFEFYANSGKFSYEVVMAKVNKRNAFRGVSFNMRQKNINDIPLSGLEMDFDDLQANMYALMLIATQKINFDYIYDVLLNTPVETILQKLGMTPGVVDD
jgi:hypothetical protein